jgi:MFS family permease
MGHFSMHEALVNDSLGTVTKPLPPWSPVARQRLLVVALTGLLLSFVYVAADVVLPLWVTHDLGLGAGDWARLRSLRFAGVLVGVIVLGAISDRFGQRRLGVVCLVGSGLATISFACGTRIGVWTCMPVLGALVSTVMVNLNTMTQAVSAENQGVANTIYRAVGAAAGIAAPIAATALALAWGGYPWVFVLLGCLLLLAAAVLAWYPETHALPPLAPLREEFHHLWQGYAQALGQREMLRFIHVSQLCGNLAAGVSAFAAIRFTRELGLSDQAFGALGTAAGALSFLLIVTGAWYLDRVSLRRLHAVLGLAAGAGACLLGAGDSVALSCAGFLLAVPMGAMAIAPSSMWVSRAAGTATQGAVFSVYKVVSALYVSTSMALLGLLEHWLGMRQVIFWGGILSAGVALAFLLLPEPPLRPRRITAGA